MSKKYYAKFVNGVPVEGSLKSFPNNPGYPYKELNIPNCCDSLNRTIILDSDFPGTCSGSPTISIDGVTVSLTGPAPATSGYTDLVDYAQDLNLAYAGVLSFAAVTGNLLSITILVPFTTFRYDLQLICE